MRPCSHCIRTSPLKVHIKTIFHRLAIVHTVIIIKQSKLSQHQKLTKTVLLYRNRNFCQDSQLEAEGVHPKVRSPLTPTAFCPIVAPSCLPMNATQQKPYVSSPWPRMLMDTHRSPLLQSLQWKRGRWNSMPDLAFALSLQLGKHTLWANLAVLYLAKLWTFHTQLSAPSEIIESLNGTCKCNHWSVVFFSQEISFLQKIALQFHESMHKVLFYW